MKRAILFLIFMIFLSTAASAVTQEWAAVYNSGGGFADYSQDIAVDSSNNIYVTGYSGSSDGWTVTTIKYNSAGVQQWVKNYDHNPGSNFGDWANAIAVDSSGNVYVTGATDTGTNQEDVLTIKYATDGTFQWAKTYNGGANGYDEGHDITVNSSTGDVYVTGRSGGNLFILRYNSAGVQQFVNIYGGTVACGYGIALNSSGEVYVTGTDGTQYHTIKRSADLTSESWSMTYGSGTAYDIDVDSSGNAYITGMSNNDCVTIKYDDANGTALWTKTYSGGASGTDGGEAIVVDSSGNAYVAGSSDDGSSMNYLTIMYDTIGNRPWVKLYDNGLGDIAHGIAIDTESPVNIYVTGESDTSASSYDFATIMYDNGGNEQWVMRYNGTGNNWDKGQAIAVYDKDNIYVTGECTVSSFDYATVKYSQAGVGTIVKWEQLPDLLETGIDVNATKPMILADDYECTTPGEITKIVVWGSWLYDILPQDLPDNVRFTLSIHDDIPDDPINPDDWSMPGNVLWTKIFQPFTYTAEIEAENIEEGWMNPPQGYIFPADTVCWKYTFTIDPCEAFYQVGTPNEPVIYWLDVQADPLDEPVAKFGWKSSLDHWNDDAVWGQGIEPYAGPWNELRYPPTHQFADESIDLAFAIYTDANEPNEPNEPTSKPLMPHTKWSQPPIEVDPESAIPSYCGWDEKSYKTYQAQDPNWHIVADDFRCIGTMPVTSIHWWGSFFDWETWASGTLPAVLPDAWWIGFWSNVPQGPYPYSYPEVLLHDFIVPAGRVTLEEVGSDEYFGYYPFDICYQFNVDLEPNEVFWQDEYRGLTQGNTFWLSIVALYQSDFYPDHPWGWKTRPWHWMDDAVRFDMTIDPAAGNVTDPITITPIEDPVFHESFDVSFELDTDPNYIKWEQLYTGIRDWPHYEDVDSTLNMMDPINERLVADDWECLTRKPVRAIVWWGSYIGYGYEACSQGPFMALPTPPDRFRLQIWTDVPAGADPCYPFSHPNDVVWMYETAEYDEVLVGYDKHPHGEPNEPVFRYSVRLPLDNWFIQEDYNGVFWLSVQAVYDTQDPIYPWGWTNHEHVYNDDAVQGYLEAGEWKWHELYDQTGASEDMSFILFTDPRECYAGMPDYAEWASVGKPECWCYPRQCHGDADGFSESKSSYYVLSTDLGVFLAAWAKPYSAIAGLTYNGIPLICADADHVSESKSSYRVLSGDLSILLTYWSQPPANVPADCQPGNVDPENP